MSTSVTNILSIIWPLIILEIALLGFALYDLVKKGKTKNLSILIWILIIVFINIFGPIAYFLFGRSEEN
jgi:hypothetical protein